MRISYHVSQEQFSPRELLGLVQHAEAVGFDAAFSSDHLQPWSPSQGHAGLTWSWLGAALQATKRMTFGAITVPGGWRYHPVVLAQAVATLGEMFPGRVPWIALGSGQALNEVVTGLPWPDKQERNARLREGADIMRALLAGETVTQQGRLSAAEARLWTRPEQPTRLVGATTNAATAGWLGGWADGLLTVRASTERVREIVAAFRQGGGDNKPMHLKVDLSWASTEAEALHQAHEQWRFNLLGGDVNWELRSPVAFEQAARFVRPDDMRKAVLVSADLGQHAAWLAECAALGFETLNLHNVGTNQRAFLDAFGRHVLPSLGDAEA